MKELTPEEIRAITESRRGFLKQDASDEPEGYKTDQQKMLPQAAADESAGERCAYRSAARF